MLIARNRAQAVLFDFLKMFPTTGIVLLPISTCEIIPITYLRLGIPFEFVDIDPQTYSMDLNLVEQRLKKYGAIWGVHYVYNYGYDTPAIRARLQELKQQYHFVLIEDKCLCRPQVEENPSDAADLTLFSTGYGKYIDIGGGFGWLHHRWNEQFCHTPVSFEPAALDKLHVETKRCATSRAPFPKEIALLPWLENKLLFSEKTYFQQVHERCIAADQHKAQINEIYRGSIPEQIQLGSQFHHWRFQIHTDKSSQIIQALFDAGLFASQHYRPLSGVFDSNSFPCAQKSWERTVNLFNDFHFDIEKAQETAKIISTIVKNK